MSYLSFISTNIKNITNLSSASDVSVAKSSFTFQGGKAFLVSLSGITEANFSETDYYGHTNLGYTNPEIYDAEKSSSTTQDDQSCWAATASNMLAYTGWGELTLNKSQSTTIEDDIFKYFYSHFKYGNLYGGNIYYGIAWFFDGTYAPKGAQGWDQPASGGNLLKISAEPYLNHYQTPDDLLQKIDTALTNGCAVGLGIVGLGHELYVLDIHTTKMVQKMIILITQDYL